MKLADIWRKQYQRGNTSQKLVLSLGVAAILTLVATIAVMVISRPPQSKRVRPVPETAPETTSAKTLPPAEPVLEEEAMAGTLAEGAENIVFPPDSGVVDVTKPPYNAAGDGQTDDTAAIQQALNDYSDKQAIIYLPKGTYLVSATLHWGKGDGKWTLCKRTTLQGQSQEHTILKLKDSSPGFGDPAAPQAVIWTGPSPAERYRNSLRNLSIDTGQKNPGAIGLQFNANYVGCLRHVLIRSGDGQGVIGLDMSFNNEIGPLLVKNVTVQGFDIGIRTKGGYGLTFEHIRLENQNQFGFVNSAQSVSIRDLASSGGVTAFWNKNVVGFAVIVDAELNGVEEAQSCAAITNEPGLFVRNLTVNGFAHAISHVRRGAGTNVAGPSVKEWASRLFPASLPAVDSAEKREVVVQPSLNLPVKETPEVPWDNPAEWVNPISFGADPGRKRDSSEAIQRAIDSGKRTVYLPRGDYLIRNPIVLRGKVRRLIGCEASIIVDSWIPAEAAVTVAEGDSPVVVMERLAGGLTQRSPHPWFIDNASSRTLVMRDCLGMDGSFTGPGALFLENVAGQFVFHGQKVWARQLCASSDSRNPSSDWWHLRNEGGVLWVLGVRTGGPGPVVTTTGGGKTELLGGLMYSYSGGRLPEQPEPAFVVDNGTLSVSIMEMSHTRFFYPVLVRRIVNGQAEDLLMAHQAPGGIGASLIPLFVTE